MIATGPTQELRLGTPAARSAVKGVEVTPCGDGCSCVAPDWPNPMEGPLECSECSEARG